MWPLQTRLAKGIWHTTHPARLTPIMNSGLKSEPDVRDSERWKASHGPKYHPFVRTIGGVSLFDFTAFDPEAYSRSHPMSTWSTFVPHRADWGGAVWIEVDPDALGERFISADDLVRRWDDGGHHRHTIMPRIECACIGDVPVSAFKSAFMTWSRGDVTRDISVENTHEAEYRAILGEWKAAMVGSKTT